MDGIASCTGFHTCSMAISGFDDGLPDQPTTLAHTGCDTCSIAAMDDRQRSQLLTLCRCTAQSIKALLHQHNAQQCSLSKSAARTTFPTSRLHHNLAASAHRTVRHGRIDDDLREGSDSGHGTVPDYVSTFVRDCACRFAVATHAWVVDAVR